MNPDKTLVNVLGPGELEHKQGTEKRKANGTAQRRQTGFWASGKEERKDKGQGVGARSLLLTPPSPRLNGSLFHDGLQFLEYKSISLRCCQTT